ncbi:MAG: NUDIX domain-containing protein [Acidimicrobiia bacterium]|nr:NUDIX domain-containing protein [Acidimicrobiia bacterium]
MSSDPAPAFPAATVMVLRPGPDGFELLMVRRPDRGAFGGLMVFPGGKVEPVDKMPLSRRVVSSTTTDHKTRSAALRELAEETGLLVTTRGVVSSPDFRGEALWRAVIEAGHTIPGDDLILVSRWLTPEISRRRFDTRFYLLSVTDPPEVRLDTEELTAYAWITPLEALARNADGEWPMILPTISHLRWLSGRASIEDARSAASGADGLTIIAPRQTEDGSLLPIYTPADEL